MLGIVNIINSSTGSTYQETTSSTGISIDPNSTIDFKINYDANGFFIGTGNEESDGDIDIDLYTAMNFKLGYDDNGFYVITADYRLGYDDDGFYIIETKGEII